LGKVLTGADPLEEELLLELELLLLGLEVELLEFELLENVLDGLL
jgi:hypothetical protein